MKKSLLRLFVVLLITSALVAMSIVSCKPAVPTAETAAETKAAETKAAETVAPAEITKIVVGSEAGTGWTKHLMEQSEIWAKDTGNKVEFVEIPYSDMATKYLTELVSGSGAYDAISCNRDGWTIPFAAAGYLEPLDQLLSEEEWNDYFPIAKSTASWDGHVYAIPQNMCAEAFYYRTDLLEQYGVDVPTNWDEMLDAAKKLTLDTNDDGQVDIYGLGLKGKRYIISAFWLLDFMHQNGASVFDEEGNVVCNSPEAVEALQLLSDLLLVHKVVSPGSLNDDETTLHTAFMEGKISMLQNWNYMWALANDPAQSKVAGKFNAVPVPGNVNQGVVSGGWNFAIPKSSKNIDVAKEWLLFVTRPEADKSYALNYETQPARLSTFNDSEVKAKYGEWIDTLKNIHLSAFAVPQHPKWLEIADALQEAVQNAYTEKMTPKEALDQAATSINEMIKE
jgi:ABC-type glycerol-3-phosphate transport system substrate-binding protein